MRVEEKELIVSRSLKLPFLYRPTMDKQLNIHLFCNDTITQRLFIYK